MKQTPKLNRAGFMLSFITVQTSSIFSTITENVLKWFKIFYNPATYFNYKTTLGTNSTSLSFMYIMVAYIHLYNLYLYNL